MKAAICTAYGSPNVLKITEVEKPEPKGNQLRIKIYASAVTQSDIFIRSMNIPIKYRFMMRLIFGWKKPRQPILGLLLAGKVDKVGENIKRFKPGDKVFGLTGFNMGGYAEYTCMKEVDSKVGCLVKMPENIDYEQATTVAYGGLLALQYLEKGNVQQCKKVLIYGASGTCGTTAVQIAKYYGAHVTAVCSTANVDMVKQLGADNVLDYTQVDSVPKDETYDLVLDAVGNIKTSKLKQACKKALTNQGKYVSIDDGDLKLSSERLTRIKTMVENGYFKPVMDTSYTLDQLADAHAYVEKGHKKGGVAIKIAASNN